MHGRIGHAQRPLWARTGENHTIADQKNTTVETYTDSAVIAAP